MLKIRYDQILVDNTEAFNVSMNIDTPGISKNVKYLKK